MREMRGKHLRGGNIEWRVPSEVSILYKKRYRTATDCIYRIGEFFFTGILCCIGLRDAAAKRWRGTRGEKSLSN